MPLWLIIVRDKHVRYKVIQIMSKVPTHIHIYIYIYIHIVLVRIATKLHTLPQGIYYCDVEVSNLLITYNVHILTSNLYTYTPSTSSIVGHHKLLSYHNILINVMFLWPHHVEQTYYMFQLRNIELMSSTQTLLNMISNILLDSFIILSLNVHCEPFISHTHFQPTYYI